MRRFVYNAKPLFTEIERRLNAGERIITYLCELPGCTPARGKIYFFKQPSGYVVGVCTENNLKTVTYGGDNRDMKWLVEKQAICFDSVPKIMNMFFRMDAVYSSTATRLVYYVDGYGYYKDGKYVFSLEKVNGSWRAYIEAMPDFGGRDPSAAITHRLSDGARKYVCVQGSVGTKKRMCEIAKTWARFEQRYIETGQRFPG